MIDPELKTPVVHTVGAAAVKLLEKANSTSAGNAHTVIDQTQEQISKYYDNLIQCIKDNKDKFASSFYVVVITKKERLLENVIRNYFFARVSCPTPDYDQAVYFYDAKAEQLSFVWVLPDKETSMMLLQNWGKVAPEERDLLQFVIDFSSGKLFWLAKKLNGEQETSPLLEN
jgi:hypothetical protein